MAFESTSTPISYEDVALSIDGRPEGKNLLSINQLSQQDIMDYISEAYAAEALVNDPRRYGMSLLAYAVLKAIMKQPSTRTGGSCTTAMQKLGGSADLISGMNTSSEAKGESVEDTWVAFAAQADILGIRTKEDYGPKIAATAIAMARLSGQMEKIVPVINLGDGKNEHPTQALGDMFTIHKKFKRFEDLTAVVVGDHERYRAHHSFMLAAAELGMRIVAVEAPCSLVPDSIAEKLGDSLKRTTKLDQAIRSADILYMGRNPDEYSDEADPLEKDRSQQLALSFSSWIIDRHRLGQMPEGSIVMHPRPRRDELAIDSDLDHRMKDVQQMVNMIPMRMAIFARHLGKSIKDAI